MINDHATHFNMVTCHLAQDPLPSLVTSFWAEQNPFHAASRKKRHVWNSIHYWSPTHTCKFCIKSVLAKCILAFPALHNLRSGLSLGKEAEKTGHELRKTRQRRAYKMTVPESPRGCTVTITWRGRLLTDGIWNIHFLYTVQESLTAL